MAGASLLSLIDDIASILNDVGRVSAMAIKHSSGIVGDDIALNSEQVSERDVRAERELPIIWAVAKGSICNKLVLIPVVLAFSVWAQWAIGWLMLIGAFFLSYEGAEKFLTWLATLRSHQVDKLGAVAQQPQGQGQANANEAMTIRGAIQTDFVLSAEILVLCLTFVTNLSFGQQLVSLLIVSVVMTVVVYGGVAIIIKLDDIGVSMKRRSGASAILGRSLIRLAPRLLQFISWAGMIAMFSVSGSLFFEHVIFLHRISERFLSAHSVGWFVEQAAHCLCGLILGLIVYALIHRLRRLMPVNK